MNIFKRIYCRVFQLGFKIALPILPYRNPIRLNRLSEIIEILNQRNIGAILLVADKTVRDLGLLAGFEAELKEAGIRCAVYEQATPNPTVADVETARLLYTGGNCGATVTVGGGSAMDCAKGVGARIARPNKSIQKMQGLLKVRARTPLLFAVPTTAGTGSEATVAAVITDSETHHKCPINDFGLIPDYAVLDETLTLKLPPFVTATTGLDALTHAVEAYIGRTTTFETREMSIQAVRLIRESLETCVTDGANRAARKDMLQASFFAGCAFTRSYVGYVHGIAHSLGGRYGVAHGLANAVILPVFLREYGSACEKKLADLARKSGLVPLTTETTAACEAFICWIEGLNERFGLPKTFPQIREEDIDEMAGYADRESNPLYPVPKLMDKKELSAMYRKLMETEKRETDGN